MSTRTLHVVTHRRWVADDLAAGAPSSVTVRHCLGLDLPDFEPGDGLWAPMEWTVRAHMAGPNLLLADPGPRFLTQIAPEHLRRRVSIHRLVDVETVEAVEGDQIPAVPSVGFFKPANIKVETLPARWGARTEFARAARAAGLPDDSLILVADIWLHLVEEHRVFVLHGEPVTSSPYLQRDGRTGEETLWEEAMTSSHGSEARAFAADALARVPARLIPPALVIDVARTAADDWVVVETNPVWSSGFYGCAPAAVVACLMAANMPVDAEATDPTTGFDWVPDPWLIARARQQRPLPRPWRRQYDDPEEDAVAREAVARYQRAAGMDAPLDVRAARVRRHLEDAPLTQRRR